MAPGGAAGAGPQPAQTCRRGDRTASGRGCTEGGVGAGLSIQLHDRRQGHQDRAPNGASHFHSCTLTSHVVTGGLHHHPLHVPVPQPHRQFQQLRGGGGVAAALLHPGARLRCVRHPHTRFQPRLCPGPTRPPTPRPARSPRLLLSSVSFLRNRLQKRLPAGTETGIGLSRTLVLMATMRSPIIGSPESNCYTGSPAPCKNRPRRATATRFSRTRASPKGTKKLLLRATMPIRLLSLLGGGVGALVERRVVGADDEQVGVLALVELGEPGVVAAHLFQIPCGHGFHRCQRAGHA